ncbi:MAG: beta-lactamase family protein [Lachnospiraceae bacterium]|nr:beta-lactamase family protein [Lachnospiraceae bacterium]
MDFTNLKMFMNHMAEERTPGNSIEVFLKGKRVFQYFAGYADLENAIPLVGDEMYNIYSCSKITTVVAGVQLLEQGKILLSDPLYEYMPEFRNMFVLSAEGNLTRANNYITVGDLFSMTAGFTYNLEAPGFQKAREVTAGKMDTVRTIQCIARDPLSFEPGTHWQYSICHDVLAALISVVSGHKFRDYVKENIFEPLEMKESVYHQTPEVLEKMAQQYLFIQSNDENNGNVQGDERFKDGYFKNVGKAVKHILGEEYDSGGAGIITTVSDYAKLMAALAGYGTGVNGERILSPGSINLMRANRLSDVQKEDFNWKHLAGYGYGLGVRTHISQVKSGMISNLGEFGWDGAAGALSIVDPDIGLGVFYAQHTLNPRENYYQPRIRNVIYSCLK